jgi:hypothetical protein
MLALVQVNRAPASVVAAVYDREVELDIGQARPVAHTMLL